MREVLALAETHSLHLLFLSETGLAAGASPGFPGRPRRWRWIGESGGAAGSARGVGWLVRASGVRVRRHSNRQVGEQPVPGVIWLQVRGEGGPAMHIAGVYVPPQSGASRPDLRAARRALRNTVVDGLAEHARAIQRSHGGRAVVAVVGDMNSRIGLSGAPPGYRREVQEGVLLRPNTQGNQLLAGMARASLYALNGIVGKRGVQTPAQHTFQRGAGVRTLLDLALVSAAGLQRVVEFRTTGVLRAEVRTDHAMLLLVAEFEEEVLHDGAVDRRRPRQYLPFRTSQLWGRYFTQARQVSAGAPRHLPAAATISELLATWTHGLRAEARALLEPHMCAVHVPVPTLIQLADDAAAKRHSVRLHRQLAAVEAEWRRASRRRDGGASEALRRRLAQQAREAKAARERVRRAGRRLKRGVAHSVAANIRALLMGKDMDLRHDKVAMAALMGAAGVDRQSQQAASADQVRGADGSVVVGAQRVRAVWNAHLKAVSSPAARTTPAAVAAGQRQAETVAAADADRTDSGPAPVHPEARVLNGPIEEQEVLNAARRMKSYRGVSGRTRSDLIRFSVASPSMERASERDDEGTDSLPPADERETVRLLTRIANRMLDTGEVPVEFRESVVTVVYKGSGDQLDPNNYRPISVSSAMHKLIANVLQVRLLRFAEAVGALGEYQFGFREGRRVDDVLFLLMEKVRRRFRRAGGGGEGRDRWVWALFVDIMKAYDSVDLDALFSELWRLGVRGKMYRLLRAWYARQRKRVRLGGELGEPYEPTAGVAQGDPMSPTLFIMFLVATVAALAARAAELRAAGDDAAGSVFDLISQLLFADDITLLADSREELQQLVDVLDAQAAVFNFRVSLRKSKVMVFRPPGSLPEQLPEAQTRLTSNGNVLQVVTEFKLLGVVLTPDLRPQKHLEKSLNALRGGTFASLRLLRSGGVSDPRLGRMLLYMYAVSVGEFGCAVWGDPTTACRVREDKDKLLSKVMAEYLGVGNSRGLSNAAVGGEMGWLGLEHRLARYRMRYLVRAALLPGTTLVRRVHEANATAVAHRLRAGGAPVAVDVEPWHECTLRLARLMQLPDAVVTDTRAYLLGERVGTVAEAEAWAATVVQTYYAARWLADMRRMRGMQQVFYARLHPQPVFASYLDAPGWRTRQLRTALRLNQYAPLGVVVGRRAGVPHQHRGPCAMCGVRGPETVRHFLLECARWRAQRARMWDQVRQVLPRATRAQLRAHRAGADAAVVGLAVVLAGDCTAWFGEAYHDKQGPRAAARRAVNTACGAYLRDICAERERAALREAGGGGGGGGGGRGGGGGGGAAAAAAATTTAAASAASPATAAGRS